MEDKEVVEVLLKVRTSDSVKLAYGIARRGILSDALARGEVPDDRRVDWIKSVVEGMRQLLMESARVFNESYPQDRISVSDMQDCLNTMSNRLWNS